MRPPEECPKAAPPWSISGPVSGYVCHFLLSCSRSSQVPTPSHYHFYSFSAMNLPLTGGVATFSLTLTPSSQPHTHTHTRGWITQKRNARWTYCETPSCVFCNVLFACLISIFTMLQSLLPALCPLCSLHTHTLTHMHTHWETFTLLHAILGWISPEFGTVPRVWL